MLEQFYFHLNFPIWADIVMRMHVDFILNIYNKRTYVLNTIIEKARITTGFITKCF